VIALVLHLNPNLPLHPSRLAPLLATVGLYYVVHLTVIGYIRSWCGSCWRAKCSRPPG